MAAIQQIPDDDIYLFYVLRHALSLHLEDFPSVTKISNFITELGVDQYWKGMDVGIKMSIAENDIYFLYNLPEDDRQNKNFNEERYDCCRMIKMCNNLINRHDIRSERIAFARSLLAAHGIYR